MEKVNKNFGVDKDTIYVLETERLLKVSKGVGYALTKDATAIATTKDAVVIATAKGSNAVANVAGSKAIQQHKEGVAIGLNKSAIVELYVEPEVKTQVPTAKLGQNNSAGCNDFSALKHLTKRV